MYEEDKRARKIRLLEESIKGLNEHIENVSERLSEEMREMSELQDKVDRLLVQKEGLSFLLEELKK